MGGVLFAHCAVMRCAVFESVLPLSFWPLSLPPSLPLMVLIHTHTHRYRHAHFDPNVQAGSPPPKPAHPYRTIGCIFNHTSFYANAQPSDSVLTCGFSLHNRSQWKIGRAHV